MITAAEPNTVERMHQGLAVLRNHAGADVSMAEGVLYVVVADELPESDAALLALAGWSRWDEDAWDGETWFLVVE